MTLRTSIRDITWIALLRCIAELLINPIGNFPLNDDWAWGQTVEVFLRTGSFQPTGWGPMSLLSHVVWGSVFCLPGGFSFTALRMASLVASLLGAAGCYAIAREAGGGRALAVVAALTWLFNPITFGLSATFMTDVPFAAAMIWSARFFARHLRDGTDRSLVAGALLAIVAILSRQIAIVVPVSFALALVAYRGFRRDAIARALLAIVSCYAVLSVFERWLVASGRVPQLYRPLTIGFFYAVAHPHTAGGDLRSGPALAAVYLGCLLLPVLVAIAPQMRAWQGIRTRIVTLTVVSALVAVLIRFLASTGSVMPLSGNVLTPQGIGPMTLRDSYILGMPTPPPLPAMFWQIVTAISVVGAVLLAVAAVSAGQTLGRAVRARHLDGVAASGLFFLICAAGLLTPLFAEGFIDRYLIQPLPFVAAASAALVVGPAAPHVKGRAITLAGMLLVLFAGFSVAGTRDYLSWNRVRWNLLDDMLSSHRATAAQIDGGFEFNARYLYSPDYVAAPGKSWWWVADDKFIVAFDAIPGWDVEQVRTFRRWLPPGEGKIVLLARKTRSATDAPESSAPSKF